MRSSTARIRGRRLTSASRSGSAGHGMGTGSVDFFISYTSRYWSWASGLDFLLREQVYSTLVQGYDFAIGKSFVRDMCQALKQCRFVACLLSPAYLESGWCQKELEAGRYADKLVLLRIAECKLDGLLAPYAYADLFDLDAAAARELALAQLHKRIGHDPRPKVSPLFPRRTASTSRDRPQQPGQSARCNQPRGRCRVALLPRARHRRAEPWRESSQSGRRPDESRLSAARCEPPE